MDFEPSETVAPVVERVRRFVDEKLIAVERDLLTKGFDAIAPSLRPLREEARAIGVSAGFLPREHGGAGMPLTDFAFVAEQLGRTLLGHYIFNCQAPDAGNMELLSTHGTHEQQERWLKPLVEGRIRSCFGMTEPARAGSNPVWLDTTARVDGDDYVIDGRKWFTTGADGSAFCIVMAVTSPDAPSPYLRASQIIVPEGTPGYRLVRNIPVMGESGGGWASHGEVVFENVRVPVTNRLGEEGTGFLLAQERLGPGRIHHCMRWIGICERAFDLMCQRAATRELSPGKMLGTKQMVHAWVAESRAEIDAARLLVLRAAWRIEKDGAAAARDEISAIKFHTANVLQTVLDRSIQAHGAYGLVDELPLAWWWRHERGARIYDGADEVHETSLARRILSRYGGSDV